MPCFICKSPLKPTLVGMQDCPRKIVPRGKRLTFCGKCFAQHQQCAKRVGDLSDQCKAALEGGQAKVVPAAQVALAQARVGDFPSLTHYVPQGRCATLNCLGDNTIIFGTRGCGTCVGVLAQLTGSRIFCAHLDHDIKGPRPEGVDQGEAWKASKASVYMKLPPYDEVRSIHMTRTSNDWITELTIKAIREIYGQGKTLLSDLHFKDAIWWVQSTGNVQAGTSSGPVTGRAVQGEKVGFIIDARGRFVLA